MDARAAELSEFVPPMMERPLTREKPDDGALDCDWLPLEVDTFAITNH